MGHPAIVMAYGRTGSTAADAAARPGRGGGRRRPRLEPPRPGELARLERQGRLDEAIARARAIGNHKVAPALLQGARERLQRAQLGLDAPLPAPPAAWRGMPTKGTVKVLALLIRFSDYASKVGAAAHQAMLFGGGDPAAEPYESLHDYYVRSSYGQLDIQGDVLGWYNTGQPRSAVVESRAGREALIKKALDSLTRPATTSVATTTTATAASTTSSSCGPAPKASGRRSGGASRPPSTTRATGSTASASPRTRGRPKSRRRGR